VIPNEAKRQKAYECLRKLTSGRIERALGLADDDLADLTGLFCTSRREREFTRRTAGHGNQEV